MLTNERKKEIIVALSQRIEKMNCPICQKENFSLLDGYINEGVQDDYKHQVIGVKTRIPSVALVCNNCGFISQHSLGVLGLLPQQEESTDK